MSIGGEATSCAIPALAEHLAPEHLAPEHLAPEPEGGQAVSALPAFHGHVLRSARTRFNPLTLADADEDPEHIPEHIPTVRR